MASCKDCIHYDLCNRIDAIFNYYNTPSPIHLPTGCSDFFRSKADVVEVKHGEWLKTEEPLGYRDVECIECSACHDSWVIDEDFDFEDHKQYWKYCPNCGARMDGERRETNAE